MKAMHIKWIDSISQSGWLDSPSKLDMRCETIGWFVKEDKDSIIVALNRSHENDGVGHIIQIPKAAIKSKKWIKT